MLGVQLQLTAMQGTPAAALRLGRHHAGDWNRASTLCLPAAHGEAMKRRRLCGWRQRSLRRAGGQVLKGPQHALATGAMGRALAPLLKELGLDFEWAPDSCLEGLWRSAQIQIRGGICSSPFPQL